MKTRNTILPIVALLLMAGCKTNDTVQPGSDPIVVNAQATMKLARATFDMIEKSEYDAYPAFKAANPSAAAAVRAFVNNLRANETKWLRTAYNLTEAYRTAPSEGAYRDLNKALAVLSAAIAESNTYLSQLPQTSAWISPELWFAFSQLNPKE